MLRQFIFSNLLLLAWTFLFHWAVQKDLKHWGDSGDFSSSFKVILQQKERSMHKTPEILVSYCSENARDAHHIGTIALPEDNRNNFHYEFEWIDKSQLYLVLHCDYCMQSIRKYHINLQQHKPELKLVDVAAL